jgi:hypothetical protein
MAMAQSYRQKISDLRNFQKMSEYFKPTIFLERSENYLLDVLARLTTKMSEEYSSELFNMNSIFG